MQTLADFSNSQTFFYLKGVGWKSKEKQQKQDS